MTEKGIRKNTGKLQHIQELLTALESDELDVRVFSGKNKCHNAPPTTTETAMIDRFALENLVKAFRETREEELHSKSRRDNR